VSNRKLLDLGEWLAPFCRRVAENRLQPLGVRLSLSAEPAVLDVDRCWRIGLIVALLVEEIARRAFHSRGGIILIEVAAHSGKVFLCVSNNGEPQAATGGQGVVRPLACELGGQLDWRPATSGSAALLSFPLIDERGAPDRASQPMRA
jgi:hypothetical protein